MDKVWLIIKREYTTRVLKRSFILATLLTPLGIAALIAVAALLGGYQSDDAKRVAVLDEADVIDGGIKDEGAVTFRLVDGGLEDYKQAVRDGEYDAVLRIPPQKDLYADNVDVYYYSDEGLTLDIEGVVRDRVRKYVRDYRAEQLGLDERNLGALSFDTRVEPEPIDDDGEDLSRMTSVIGAGIGMLMGFVMYITVFVYGMMVMRSVMEEKTTRIVEVMISSVKPFQLMLGKIVGVGLVGLTQVLAWAVLIPLVIAGASLYFGFDAVSASGGGGAGAGAEAAANVDENTVLLALQEIGNQNWWAIIPLFLIYFLGGYFVYASLFAAVGSAVGEDLAESNTLTLPISIPVIISFYIMIAVIEAPNSTLAIWSSQFPLFSPIVMPARLAFSPPVWEVVLSVTLLVAGALFFVWLAARIYRTGILLYGKKASFKELGKWIVRG